MLIIAAHHLHPSQPQQQPRQHEQAPAEMALQCSHALTAHAGQLALPGILLTSTPSSAV
jgi:hypothetical protein